MTEGALGTLDDFSSMYWPEDVDFLSRSTQGAFSGIGVQIARRDQQLTVVSPLNGTPAQQAGIKASDVIATVDGKDTSSWSLNKAVREITGPTGSDVEIGIQRPGETEARTYVIKRSRIEIESVKGWAHTPSGDWDYWIDKDAGIGYLRLTQFIPQSAHKIDLAVAKLRDEGQLNSMIIDLRHQPRRPAHLCHPASSTASSTAARSCSPLISDGSQQQRLARHRNRGTLPRPRPGHSH